jgi:hypothetical protein
MKTKLKAFLSRKSLLIAALAASSATLMLPCGAALALNPQPLPPGFALRAINPGVASRALNPQPLPPGLYSPNHPGPAGGLMFSHGGHIPK